MSEEKQDKHTHEKQAFYLYRTETRKGRRWKGSAILIKKHNTCATSKHEMWSEREDEHLNHGFSIQSCAGGKHIQKSAKTRQSLARDFCRSLLCFYKTRKEDWWKKAPKYDHLRDKSREALFQSEDGAVTQRSPSDPYRRFCSGGEKLKETTACLLCNLQHKRCRREHQEATRRNRPRS